MITVILITIVIVLALTIASQEDMIFEFFQDWGEKKEKNGAKWVKPIITCPACMPSIYSLFGYTFAWLSSVEITWKLLAMYPIVVGTSSVCVTIIWTIYLWIDSQIPYYRNLEKLTHFDIKDRKELYNRKQNGKHIKLNSNQKQ